MLLLFRLRILPTCDLIRLTSLCIIYAFILWTIIKMKLPTILIYSLMLWWNMSCVYCSEKRQVYYFLQVISVLSKRSFISGSLKFSLALLQIILPAATIYEIQISLSLQWFSFCCMLQVRRFWHRITQELSLTSIIIQININVSFYWS